MMAEINETQKQLLASTAQVQASQNQLQMQQQSPSHNQQQPQQNILSNGQTSLTIRLLMQGKEVGSIIGKKGDNIKRFRELSGAKINVSDSSCPDRIVTLVGSMDEVYHAFSMICAKFEDQMLQVNTGPGGIILSGSPTKSGAGQLGSVTDPLFGLPSTGLLNNSLKDGGELDPSMLTINNNNASTLNNNNISAPNNNLSSEDSTSGSAASSNKDIGVVLVGGSNGKTSSASASHPLITLRLIIPASQCGSLIGRGGAKIKEIRELTGATIQIAPDVLPNSTERVVTISGNIDSLKSCAYQVCNIMVESPPKGPTIPYRPKPALNPMLFAAASAGPAAAAAYNLPGQFALSAHPDVNRLFLANNPLVAAFNPNPTAANLRAATGQAAAAAALSAVAASQSLGSHEMMIPNSLIGCVIGKGGSKINEIRQLSGATIKISNSEEESKNRTVTISGVPEAINLAQYLITASYSLHQSPLLESLAKSSIINKTARKFAPY